VGLARPNETTSAAKASVSRLHAFRSSATMASASRRSPIWLATRPRWSLRGLPPPAQARDHDGRDHDEAYSPVSATRSLSDPAGSPGETYIRKTVGRTGFEPVTSSVSGKRSPAELTARDSCCRTAHDPAVVTRRDYQKLAVHTDSESAHQRAHAPSPSLLSHARTEPDTS
jgi:hypothetical protein